jgi:hypothetical protein
MNKGLALNNDTEYMYIFIVCLTLAEKSLLDEGDASAFNLARALKLDICKLKSNQLRVL